MLNSQNAVWMNRLTATVTAAAVMLGMGTTLAQSDDEVFVVVRAGRIITDGGDEILRGEIVLVDGKISLVGKNL
jgi:hypothetical protein